MNRTDILANRASIYRCSERPGLYRVVKVNTVNVLLEEVTSGQRLSAHPSFLRLADGVLDDAPVNVEPYEAPLNPGTVVRFRPGIRKAPEGLWVIVRSTGETYSVHPLGGSSRYYRGVRRDQLDIVTGPVEIPSA